MLFVNGRAEVSHTAWFAVNFYSLCFLIGTRNLIELIPWVKNKRRGFGSALLP